MSSQFVFLLYTYKIHIKITLCIRKSDSACRIHTLCVEIIFINHTQTCRNHARECHIHTHTCQNYTRVCKNHTLRVEITLVRIEITVVRVVITFMPVKYTLRVEITLCV
jgi:hypothetical protein